MVRALEKLDKGQFVTRLDSFLHKSLMRVSEDVFKPRQLRILKGSDPLFEYKVDPKTMVISGGEFVNLTGDPKTRENLLDSLDRVGAFDLVSDFLPSTSTKMLISGTLDKIGSSKDTSEEDWAMWFLSLIHAVKAASDSLVLVPDTNFFMRHYCSNILLPLLGKGDFKKLRFKLARLVISEIEAKCNRAKERSLEKRLALFAAREALFLMQQFATNFPQVDRELQTAFSNIAGKGFADSLIRREIHDFIKLEGKGVVFLTADLMNALAATAEGLDVLYFTRKDEEPKPIRDVEQLAELVIDTAITFEEIRIDAIVGEETKQSVLVEGMWSGKTPSDWQNDCIRMSSVDA